MPTLLSRLPALAALLSLAACSAPPPAPADAVVIRYQHVANAHEVRFASPLALAPRSAGYVLPRSRQGFWAIFVLCSLDVGARVPRFIYNVNNFRVDYAGAQSGPLRPYDLRFEDSADLNGPLETPALGAAIAGELQRGPTFEVFSPGAYPALDYRIALFVPKGLEAYAGDQLALRYLGQSTVLIGNGYPPFDIPVVGGSGTGVAYHCLP
ncbi:MAG: hypothetical protein ACXWKJ_21310 [Telluria sp.]